MPQPPWLVEGVNASGSERRNSQQWLHSLSQGRPHPVAANCDATGTHKMLWQTYGDHTGWTGCFEHKWWCTAAPSVHPRPHFPCYFQNDTNRHHQGNPGWKKFGSSVPRKIISVYFRRTNRRSQHTRDLIFCRNSLCTLGSYLLKVMAWGSSGSWGSYNLSVHCLRQTATFSLYRSMSLSKRTLASGLTGNDESIL